MCVDGLCICELYEHQAQTFFYTWLYRSEIHAGISGIVIQHLQALLPSKETMLFIVEAYLLAEHYQDAMEVLSTDVKSGISSEPFFTPAEKIEWNDGFSSVEGRAFSFMANRQGLRIWRSCLISKLWSVEYSGTWSKSNGSAHLLVRHLPSGSLFGILSFLSRACFKIFC